MDERSKNAANKRNSFGNDFEERLHEENGTQIIDDIYMPPPPLQPKNLDDQTGERLIIDTIGITNFKSFGGHTVLGPFYKSFNAIVGPNGSGKSNVIDSMLFVFGYRAQKLRCTKISSIIHHSELMPNCEYARVDVNFAIINDQGDDEINIINGSRFTISRRVNKDNSSYYMIDDRRVMFKDVSKKLHDVGIDLCYNRFLILQGEVEQISLMKPKADQNNDIGMLEYLEDIIGTSRYKEPIDKLSVKYDQLNEQRTQHVIRVNFAQKELKSMEKARNEAIKALELENKKKIEKSKLIQFQQFHLCRKMQKHEDEYAKFQQKVDDLDKEQEKICMELKKLEEDEKMKSKEYSLMKKEADESKSKFKELNENDLYLNQRIKSTKDKLKKLKNKINENEKKITELSGVPKKNDEIIETLEKCKSQLETQIKEIDEQITKETDLAQKTCVDLMQQRDELNVEFIQFKDKQSAKLDKMNAAHNQYQIYKQQIDAANNKYEQIQSKYQQLKLESDDKNKMINKYRQQIPLDQQKMNDGQLKLESLQQKREELIKLIHQKGAELLDRRQSLNRFQSRDTVRSALIDAKHKGQLKGLFGRLGDLGSIDKRYDIAISTACGRLKNFVVDTIDNAQKCVEFLKANQLPPTTFIALDKLRVKWQTTVEMPEQVPRLFDLVQINDERIRPAFYYALGETLVAKDIDQAMRITSKKRYRVVTLSGEMIEMDGAMSGGGRPKSGGMGQTIVADMQETAVNVGALEKDIETLKKEQQQIDMQINTIQEDINKLDQDVKMMQDKMNGYLFDVEELNNRMKQMEQQMTRQSTEINQMKANKQMEEAEKEYNKYKDIYEKSMSQTNQLQDKLSDLEQLIDSKINERMAPLKTKRRTLEKNMKDNQTQLNQLLSEKTAAELNLKKAEETLVNDRRVQQETEQQMADIRQQIADLENVAKEITEKYEKAQEECQCKEQQLHHVRAQIAQIENKLNLIKNRKLDLKLEADEKFKFLKEKRERIAQYKAELEAIKLDPIDYCDDDDNDHIDQSDRRQAMSIPILSEDELANLSADVFDKNLKSIENELTSLSPNFGAIEIYRKTREDYLSKVNDLNEVSSKRDLYMEHLRETKNRRFKEFKTGCLIIARKLKELYRSITLGGDADLEFIDSLDPFSEGINYAVRPNMKTWKINIHLSGGEKTLASLALIFALHYYKPSPLYIMDEIDAALDFKNVSIIANYIKERTRNTQFLIISLRNNMYELADRLIGIYKTFNMTKTIPFDPKAFDRKLALVNTQTTNSQKSQNTHD